MKRFSQVLSIICAATLLTSTVSVNAEETAVPATVETSQEVQKAPDEPEQNQESALAEEVVPDNIESNESPINTEEASNNSSSSEPEQSADQTAPSNAEGSGEGSEKSGTENTSDGATGAASTQEASETASSDSSKVNTGSTDAGNTASTEATKANSGSTETGVKDSEPATETASETTEASTEDTEADPETTETDTESTTESTEAEEETEETESDYDVVFSGLDDVTINAGDSITLTDGVTAYYLNDKEEKHELTVYVVSVSGDLYEENSGRAWLSDGTTLHNAEGGASYTVTYGVQDNDDTASRVVHVNEGKHNISFDGISDTKIDAYKSFDLMNGISAFWKDHNGHNHNVDVSIESVKASKGSADVKDATLVDPKDGVTYTVTYKAEDHTAERHITAVDHEIYDVLFSGIDDVEIEKGKAFDLLDGVAAKYKDHDGNEHEVPVVIDSVKDGESTLSDQKSKDTAYLKDGSLMNPQADAKYTVTYALDSDSRNIDVDTTTKRIISVHAKQITLKTACKGKEIELTADWGVLPKVCTLKAEEVKATKEEEAAIDKSVDKDKIVSDFTLYDLTILNKDGAEIEPDGEVKVTFHDAMADVEDADELAVLHFADNDADKVEKLNVESDGEDAVVKTTSFSRFAVMLVATASTDTYTVKFSANGGTGSMADETFTYGTEQALTKNTFTRSGATFLGWSTSNGAYVNYKNGETVKNLTTAGKTITLYAVWSDLYYVDVNTTVDGTDNDDTRSGYDPVLLTTSVISMNVSFNGKLVAYNKHDYTGQWASGSKYEVVATPVTGYKITDVKNADSATSSSSGAWTATGTVTGIKSIPLKTDLKFIVERVPYNISYTLDGGTNNSSNPTTYNVATADITLKDPTRTGYTFQYWTLDGDTTNKQYTSKTVAVAQKSTGNKSFTAHWKAHTGTITYNANGGKIGPTSKTGWSIANDGTILLDGNVDHEVNAQNGGTNVIEYGQEYDVNNLCNTWWLYIVKSGYHGKEGAEWNTSPDGTGASFDDDVKYLGQKFIPTLSSTDNATMTLYANWEPNTYTVKFDMNSAYGGGTGTIADESFTYDTAKALTKNAFVPKKDLGNGLELYAFTGWNTKADGTGTAYADGASVKNLTATEGGTVTLYAQWKQCRLDANILIDGTNYGSGVDGVNHATAVTFDAYINDKQVGTTLTDYYDFNQIGSQYKFVFSAKPGYEITGVQNADNITSNNGVWTATGTLTGLKWVNTGVNAIAKRIPYTISYDLAGGTNNSSNPTTYNVATADITLKDPTRTGYTFQYWTLDGDTTSKQYTSADVAIAQKSTGNKAFTAHWMPNPFIVIVPKKIQYTNMPIGPVDETVTYDIRVSGDFAGKVNIKSTIQNPTANDKSINVTTKSKQDGGFSFAAANGGGETTQEETLRLSGTAGVGKYVGIVQYECEQVETE